MPAEPAHANAHAAIAAHMTSLFDGDVESRLPSMRNLLETPSVAQRLDGAAV
jgi:hypothetical protein